VVYISHCGSTPPPSAFHSPKVFLTFRILRATIKFLAGRVQYYAKKPRE
jgi:hypothetical protein